MKLNAYIGNPVIATQEQYNDLHERLRAIEPRCCGVILTPDRLIIENLARRTFRYPRTPSVAWVAGRLQYMADRGL